MHATSHHGMESCAGMVGVAGTSKAKRGERGRVRGPAAGGGLGAAGATCIECCHIKKRCAVFRHAMCGAQAAQARKAAEDTAAAGMSTYGTRTFPI